MSQPAGDWRADLDELDAALLDGYQSGVPVCERPFDRMADELAADHGIETDGDAIRAAVVDLLDRGLLRRFGPVLNPPVIGASTLSALRVPEERFHAVADVVDAYPQVNHNYRRDHEWNMWFVVTAATVARRDAILAEIADETGLSVLDLPMRTDYYIDLEFPVVNEDRFATGQAGTTGVEPTRIDDEPVAALSTLERRVLLSVQTGLPVTETPYRDVATQLDAPVADVLGAIETLRERNCVKRIGCVVNHVATGFDANCMVVWDVPDAELDERGVAAGSEPFVTLCYHRPRRPAQNWPYTLFTMVHGRERAAVEEKIDELAAGPLAYDHERLFSTTTLKQTGARYEDLLES